MDAKGRVATNVQKLRRDRGLTQEELAHKSGIHQTYLSGVEGGKRNPSVGVLERIAKALGADISKLFEKPQTDRRLSPDAARDGLLFKIISPTEGDRDD